MPWVTIVTSVDANGVEHVDTFSSTRREDARAMRKRALSWKTTTRVRIRRL